MPLHHDAAESPAEGVSPFEILHGHIDEVIGEWRSLVLDEPWGRLGSARLVNSLPEILPRLFRLARHGTRECDKELSEFIAEEHGYFRRGDGVPLGALADEWNHVKRACWKVLQRRAPEGEGASLAMERLDALIDDAIGFSLRGYYAPELDTLRGRGLERRGGGSWERRSGNGDRREKPPS
jgi:hypothetical protein